MDDLNLRRSYYHSDTRQASSSNTNTTTADRATDLLDLQRLREQSQYIHPQPGVPQLPQLPPPPTNYGREYAPREYLQQQQYQQDQQRQIQYQHQQERDRDQEQRQFQPQEQQQTIKREREREQLPTLNMSYAKDEGSTRAGASTRGGGASGTAPAAREDPMPSTSDFVKKLYKMLEDPAFQPVVCWGPLGDCFVVKDMNEFTKSILPRMFKHSNFASFVRQLNKYDFHKVKNTDDNQFGEHSWTFRHPDFHADRRDALENIKRKVPAQRKATNAKNAASAPAAGASTTSSSNHQPYPSQSPGPSSYHHARGRSHGGGRGGAYTRSPSPESPYTSSGGHHAPAAHHHHRDGHHSGHGAGGASGSHSHAHGGGGGGSGSSSQAQISSLTSEVARLKDESDELRARIRGLERNYESVLLEIVGFQRGMKQQDGIVQSLIGLVLDGGGGAPGAGAVGGGAGGLAGLGGSGNGKGKGKAQSPIALRSGLQLPSASSENAGSLQPQGIITPREKLRQQLQAHLLQSQQAAGSPGTSSASQLLLQIQQQRQQQEDRQDQQRQLEQQQQHKQAQQQQQQQQAQVQQRSSSFAFSDGVFADSNPFLPPQTVQRILAPAAGGSGQGFSGEDVGRATLLQMSELSRRAASGRAGQPPPGGPGNPADGAGGGGQMWGGILYNAAGEYRQDAVAGASGPTPQQQQPQSQGMSMPPTARDFGAARDVDMERIKEYDEQRRRSSLRQTEYQPSRDSPEEYVMPSPPNPVQQQQQGQQPQLQQSPPQQRDPPQQQQATGGRYTPFSASPLNPWASMMSSPFNMPEGAISSGEVMTHEGLQVYTVGHLLPRNTTVDDDQGNWSFDPNALRGSGGLISGGMPVGDGGKSNASNSPAYSGGDVGVQGASTGGFPGPAGSPEQATASSAAASSSSISSAPTGQKLRVRRSTFVPGWAVPPRVLLVDDDAVSRRLSSKFLKVFGCTIDVAVDGIGAVNKMNLEKYDLVLMDIVMPKLDGVSATNLIRKFDQGTPIISMTSNSKPNEIMTYYSSGMNDILPKPFTKEGLLDMLEKHLMHLKVMQQMSKIGRPLTGTGPPLSDASFEQALTTNAQNPFLGASSSSLSGGGSGGTYTGAPSPFNFNFFGGNGTGGDEDGEVGAAERINPLAGLGLTDEQYGMILQGLVNGDGFVGAMEGARYGGVLGTSGIVEMPSGSSGSEKRPLEDADDDREGKRSRFEVIE